jgi:hypothetical protein
LALSTEKLPDLRNAEIGSRITGAEITTLSGDGERFPTFCW